MDNKNIPEEEISILTLTDEEGNELKFEYLDVIEHKGTEYIYLLPAESKSAEIVIMEIEPVDEENENYLPIEDEQKLQKAYKLFKKKYKDVLTFSD